MNINVYVREAIEAYKQGLINLAALADELRKLEQIREIQETSTAELERLHNNLSQWLIDKAEHNND